MNTDFYQIQPEVVQALKREFKPCGSILILLDPNKVITDTLKKGSQTNIVTNSTESNLYDLDWWRLHKGKNYDWVVAATVGSSKYNEYVFEYGTQIATQGLILLDRLSFLEPTHKRRRFLLEHKLSDMIVLHPRPIFRAIGRSKDSVTSCWFVFRKNENWQDGTQISYALDWENNAYGSSLPSVL